MTKYHYLHVHCLDMHCLDMHCLDTPDGGENITMAVVVGECGDQSNG
jgi:hypothetical protein